MMSSFAYYDSNNVRVESTQREILDLVRSGVIKPSTRVEFDGNIYNASDFPSLQKIFAENAFDQVGGGTAKQNAAPVESAVSILDDVESGAAPAQDEKTGDAQTTDGGSSQTQKDDSNAAVCPNCGAATTGTPFCAKCGAALNKVVCPNCGAESTGAAFCSRCGTPLGAGRRSQRSPYGASGADGNRGSKIGFLESLSVCFRKFADFSGRASLEEYWYFFVWFLIFNFLTSGFALLILTIPFIAVNARRLHDAGHTGWWQLLGPFHLIFCMFASQPGPNKYGPEP